MIETSIETSNVLTSATRSGLVDADNPNWLNNLNRLIQVYSKSMNIEQFSISKQNDNTVESLFFFIFVNTGCLSYYCENIGRRRFAGLGVAFSVYTELMPAACENQCKNTDRRTNWSTFPAPHPVREIPTNWPLITKGFAAWPLHAWFPLSECVQRISSLTGYGVWRRRWQSMLFIVVAFA